MKSAILLALVSCFAISHCIKLESTQTASTSNTVYVKQTYNTNFPLNTKICLLFAGQVRFLAADGSDPIAQKACDDNATWKIKSHPINTNKYYFQNIATSRYLALGSKVRLRTSLDYDGTEIAIHDCDTQIDSLCLYSSNNQSIKITGDKTVESSPNHFSHEAIIMLRV